MMKTFCTHCGNSLQVDANFCDNCGQRIAPVKTVAPLPLKTVNKRKLATLAGGGAGLVAAVAGLIWALSDPAPPGQGSLSSMLSADEVFRQEKLCLSNFGYDKNPVNINTFDTGTRDMMGVLVEAGIYTGPDEVVDRSGWFSRTYLQYKHGPQAATTIKGKRLCFASGIEVTKVEYAPVEKGEKYSRVQASIEYRYADAAPWTVTPAARDKVSSRLGKDKIDDSVSLYLNEEKKWVLLTGAQQLAVEKDIRAARLAQAKSGGGFFTPGPVKAIQGAWVMSVEGYDTGRTMSFTDHSMIIDGEEKEVEFVVVSDTEIDVKVRGDSTPARITIKSPDNIRLNENGLRINLVRAD